MQAGVRAGDAVPKGGCRGEHSHLKISELTAGVKFTKVPWKLAILCCGFLSLGHKESRLGSTPC